MMLPTATQYVEAIQFPEANLGDRDLQDCAAELGRRSQPLSWNGSYAVVFRMKKSSESKRRALRCITKKVPNLKERYEAYAAFLPGAPEGLRKALVPARYLERGIRLRADNTAPWWPVVVMDWVDAPELQTWVETNLRRPNQLRELQSRFRELALEMEASQFVHGDLQHRNILVRPDDTPVLVDYDSIQLPGPRPLPLTTVGIPGFRHPLQHDQTSGRAADRFAFLVLHLGLEALAQQPGLFCEFGKVEGLLFTGKDFRNPGSSRLFQRLKGVVALRALTEAFITVCQQPADQVPVLGEFLAKLGLAGHQSQSPLTSAGPAQSHAGLPPMDPRFIEALGRLYAGKRTPKAKAPAIHKVSVQGWGVPSIAPPPPALKPATRAAVAAAPVAHSKPRPAQRSALLSSPARAPKAAPTKASIVPTLLARLYKLRPPTSVTNAIQAVVHFLRAQGTRMLGAWGVGLLLFVGLALWNRNRGGGLEGPISAVREDLVCIMGARHGKLESLIVSMDEQIDMLRVMPEDISLVTLVLADGTPKVESVGERRMDLMAARERARIALLLCETVPEAFDGILRERELNPRQKLERLQRLTGLPPIVQKALLQLGEGGVGA